MKKLETKKVSELLVGDFVIAKLAGTLTRGNVVDMYEYKSESLSGHDAIYLALRTLTGQDVVEKTDKNSRVLVVKK